MTINIENKLLSLLILIVLGTFTFNVRAFKKADGYIYDASHDNRSVVLNVVSHWLSFQSKNKAAVRDESSEFSGPFIDCGNSNYWCISGPLAIIIPKNINKRSWKFASISCSMKTERYVKTYKITCGSIRDKYKTIVDFSIIRGVISISKSGTSDQTTFRLRGKCGLFGACNSPTQSAMRNGGS